MRINEKKMKDEANTMTQNEQTNKNETKLLNKEEPTLKTAEKIECEWVMSKKVPKMK